MSFLKTTFTGGIVFVLPITVCLLLLGYVRGYTERLVTPIADWLPVEDTFALAVAKSLAIVLIVVVCFAAGLLSRSRAVSRWIGSLDRGLTGSVPGYAFLRSTVDGLVGAEQAALSPVVLRMDDGSQLAFAVERLDDGRLVVFVPDAPDPSAGSVLIVAADRVEPVDRTMTAVVRTLRALGRGSGELLSTRGKPRS
jgi:uncharacterized membrane protein